MDTALRLLLTNAATAAVVAVVALVASRVVRRPGLAHALWLLALVKLVTPPLVPLPLLPAWELVPALAAPRSPSIVLMAPDTIPLPGAGTVAAVGVVRARTSQAAPSVAETEVSGAAARAAASVEPERLPAAARLGLLAAWVLGTGALAVLSLAVVRFARFRRLLAWAEPAPAAIAARAARIAAELGLRRVPPVLVVAARIPPMLWPEPSGPRLLLPRDLLRELSVAECDALLAHELAHVQRRDHWVRLVELAATALFWWYPLTWWARAALRRAEERCCDEWVLRLLPRSAEAYAQGLLKSLTFVSSAPASVPALASGASPLYELELRLKEILMSRPAPLLARPLRLALLAAAAVGLAVFPTHARDEQAPAAARASAAPVRAAAPAPAAWPAPAQAPSRVVAPSPVTAKALATAPRAAQAPSPVSAPATAEHPTPVRETQNQDGEERALEDQRRSLDAQRRSLQQQEFELQRQEIELNARAEQGELRTAAQRLRAEGKAREAEGYEKRIEMSTRRMELERRRLALDTEQTQLQAKQEAAELAQRDQLEALEAAGNASGLATAHGAMQRADAERQKLEQALEAKHRALEAEMEAMEKQLQVLDAEEQIHAMSEATADMARSLAEQVEALRAALQTTGTRPEVEREIQRIEAAIDALKKDATPRPSPGTKTPRPAPRP